MDLYSEKLVGHIYREDNMDNMRALLLDVEEEIKRLVGQRESCLISLGHVSEAKKATELFVPPLLELRSTTPGKV